jgi:cyclase
MEKTLRRARVIPCLLLHRGSFVKTVKFNDPKYIGDPINTVSIFNEKEVDELVVLDITPSTREQGPNFSLLGDIASEAFVPLAYGGGIRTVEQAARLFRLGIEKVIINSAAAIDPQLLKSLVSEFGSQSIVVSIDVRSAFGGSYEVYIQGGTVKVPVSLDVYLKACTEFGPGELLVTSIDRDGTLKGYDIELIRMVSSKVDMPVIASGGAGSFSDFCEVICNGGASAAAAGSFFVFHGKHKAVLITYPTQSDLLRLVQARL